jgi:hypothetical protein
MNTGTNGLIFSKIIEILREVEAISKDKKNTQQGYSFRGIDDMYNALHPLFKKYGLFITSEIISAAREERSTKTGGTLIWSIIDVKFTIFAEDGSFVTSTIRGEGMDSGDKATNKAMSVALKYLVMQMFLIPTEELKTFEGDYNTHEISSTSITLPAPRKTQPEPNGAESGASVEQSGKRPKGDFVAALSAISSADKMKITVISARLHEREWTPEEETELREKIGIRMAELMEAGK